MNTELEKKIEFDYKLLAHEDMSLAKIDELNAELCDLIRQAEEDFYKQTDDNKNAAEETSQHFNLSA